MNQGLKDAVFATALAVALFAIKLIAEKDVWEIVDLKAKKWVTKQNVKPDDILKSMEDFL